MNKYCCIIASILVLVIGISSCSNEETKTQNQVAARPTIPIQQNTVTDIDGNVYRIVTIGNQSWTQTNLNVSHYRNGDLIPQIQKGITMGRFILAKLNHGCLVLL
jgi:maltose-binding protein MalE